MQEKVALGLTQFIDFTAKGSSAKTNMVRRIKYQDDYHPAFDYWKQLRDGIVQFHERNKDHDFLDSLLLGTDEKKKENYAYAIKQYRKFLRNKEVSWFDPGRANWISDELVVRSSPELGLMIDGEPHLIKLYFKGKKEKVDKRSTRTVLALLNTSTYDVNHHPLVHHSVLNIHKNNFISDNTVDEDQLIALESEAAQFMYIWNKI
ncbi:hypothetical protein [Sporosarcina sp. Te-1]|uniref:hypothetical protein n=1 Tax=Sporosarcina sp. Te-1 TaxID=2818390 RepID=UPI001A9FED17|nr:hypothetical protein [Sporosarcina sp. Te-1]QTD43282.1 hypothetical protein J3U78_03600 [Sporosarcina sp. Te-1]